MTDCADSVFFPDPFYHVSPTVEVGIAQTLIVFGPFAAHVIVWSLWELWATKRPKRRAIINGAALLAGLTIAAQIFFLQRCFHVLRCLDVLEDVDKWVIGGVTIVGALNSVAVGVVSPRAPRSAAIVLTLFGLSLAVLEWVARAQVVSIPEDKSEVFALGLPPLLSAQLLSYAMAVASLFRVQAAIRRRALRSRPCRRLEAVQLQSDPVLTRRLETYTTSAPNPPPVYCGF